MNIYLNLTWTNIKDEDNINQYIYLSICSPRLRREADRGREGVPPRLLFLLLLLGAAGQCLRQPGWSVDIHKRGSKIAIFSSI